MTTEKKKNEKKKAEREERKKFEEMQDALRAGDIEKAVSKYDSIVEGPETYVAEKEIKYGSKDKVLLVTTLPEKNVEVVYCKTKLETFLHKQVRSETNVLALMTPYEFVNVEVQNAIEKLRAEHVRVRMMFIVMREERRRSEYMGDRGEVLIKGRSDDESGVYLYTHWGASDLPAQVRDALAKHWRWDDPAYLARIVFDMMTKGSRDEESGFGISTAHVDDAWRVVELDCEAKMVRIIDSGVTESFDDFVKGGNRRWK